jgi:hypothetical protein
LTAVLRQALVIAAVVFLLAACGGSGGPPRLSPDAYRNQLAQVKQEAAIAQSHVALGLQAKSLSELRQRLEDFATATDNLGDKVAKLNPPQNADEANTELADGLHETARATRAASEQISKLHSIKEAISYLEHSPANRKGAHQVDQALTRLKQLGYTPGS